GTQGRGFAVVAEEVRRLSARSAEAAGTIREQIEGTHRQVQQGTRVLVDAGETLTTAMGSSQQLSELLDGITLSCQQQRDGIRQIDQAINAIDAATQRNVALAERTLHATRDLDDRAQRQQERCDAFKLMAPPPAAAAATLLPEPLSPAAPADTDSTVDSRSVADTRHKAPEPLPA
ncbi:MAG: methyl-accepting chemotaxis protein, partial [Pseudomonadota bacterium]|nr:methyl-accepting chemotaxis protein [Pseudomonadota bacterium]